MEREPVCRTSTQSQSHTSTGSADIEKCRKVAQLVLSGRIRACVVEAVLIFLHRNCPYVAKSFAPQRIFHPQTFAENLNMKTREGLYCRLWR